MEQRLNLYTFQNLPTAFTFPNEINNVLDVPYKLRACKEGHNSLVSCLHQFPPQGREQWQQSPVLQSVQRIAHVLSSANMNPFIVGLNYVQDI